MRVSGDNPPDAQPRAPASAKSRLRKAFSAALLFGALVYLCYVIATQWSQIGEQLAQWTLVSLLAALAAALAMLGMKATYHAILFQRLGQGRTPGALRIAAAYASSQVVRYLPGKVLGIVYQSNRLAPDVPVFRVVAANLIHGLYTNLLTLGVLTSIVVWSYTANVLLGATLWLCGGLLVALGHRWTAVERATGWLARRLPHRWHRGALPTVSSGWGSALLCAFLLLAEWVPYFAIWLLLAPATDIADPTTTAILLGASYAGASFAANLAVLMPSGLFVREALFLFVAGRLGFDPATIVALGAIARAILTLSDLLFSPIMAAVAAVADRNQP